VARFQDDHPAASDPASRHGNIGQSRSDCALDLRHDSGVRGVQADDERRGRPRRDVQASIAEVHAEQIAVRAFIAGPPCGSRGHDSPVVGAAAAVSPSTNRAPRDAGAPGDGRIPEARLNECLYELKVVVAPKPHSERMFPRDSDSWALGRASRIDGPRGSGQIGQRHRSPKPAIPGSSPGCPARRFGPVSAHLPLHPLRQKRLNDLRVAAVPRYQLLALQRLQRLLDR
jgi:hypothetical protein